MAKKASFKRKHKCKASVPGRSSAPADLGVMPIEAVRLEGTGKSNYTVKAENKAVIEVQLANKVFYVKRSAGNVPYE